MAKAIESMVKRYYVSDHNQTEGAMVARDEKYVATLRKRLAKIRNWPDDNGDKPGKSGPRKSNITNKDEEYIIL